MSLERLVAPIRLRGGMLLMLYCTLLLACFELRRDYGRGL
jgi:hypothetical protein